MIDLLPKVGKRALGLTFPTGSLVGPAFNKAQNFPDRERIRITREEIAAIRAATRLYEAGLFQTGEDEFEKLLRNGLTAGNLGDFDRLLRRLACEVEDGSQCIFTFNRDVQPRSPRRGRGNPIPARPRE